MNMIRIRKGTVVSITSRNDRITLVYIKFDDIIEKALNYNYLSGDIKVNDIVYINSTANFLKLGTGGYNYVIINETRGYITDINKLGHIMKLRYTPFQLNCSLSEEECLKYDNIKNNFGNLGGMVVITGELHSMLSPTACCLKYINKDIKVVYIMTDGGSLPIDFSFSVNELKCKKIITYTITSGNAFGGDMEAVNIYDALIIAHMILKCDIAIVTMGPGIVGTGTKYGFSGIEQGAIIDCINTIKGIPLLIPRISFKDLRKRHYGISHHTLTILSEIAKTKAHVIFPVLEDDKMDFIKSQVATLGIEEKHFIHFVDCDTVFMALNSFNINVSTMGRGLHEEREFFMACSSAACYALSILNKYTA